MLWMYYVGISIYNLVPEVNDKRVCSYSRSCLETCCVLSTGMCLCHSSLQEVESLSKDVLQLKQEAETLQKLADEMQANSASNERAFRLFQQE